MKITVIRGDITKLEVDALVNAANPSLFGGGGVDGAIHRAAGLLLKEECLKIRKERYPQGLPIGEAVATQGYNSKAKIIIHTVGPRFEKDDLHLLEACYANSLKIAEAHNCKTIAFPAISTGLYKVPLELSAQAARGAIEKSDSSVIQEIILVLYGQKEFDFYADFFDK